MPVISISRLSWQDTDIIVFPEDGLMAFGMTRDQIHPYLQQIPGELSPCAEGSQTDRRFILHRLSCMASENSIYLVANVGTIEECEGSSSCPPDGRFQYNTNVVFDSAGNIVSVYRKWNLFYELMFDFPPGPEYAIFSTPIGTFASFVCFDILFKEPAVDLVVKHNVTNILFPTAWGSVLPAMSGIGYHESWAVRMGVNLVTSQLHVPELRFAGSVIAAGADGAVAYSNRYENGSEPQMLTATLPASPPHCHRARVDIPPSSPATDTFQSIMQKNVMTFTRLRNTEGTLYLTSDNVACYLTYRFESHDPGDIFAFGIHESLHKSSLNSSIQICALVRCAGADLASCGDSTRETRSIFSLVDIRAEFTSDYIYPSVLGDKGRLVDDWKFTLDERNVRGRLVVNSAVTEPLLSVMLFTRVYDQDNNVIARYYHGKDDVSGTGRHSSDVSVYLVCLLVALVCQRLDIFAASARALVPFVAQI